MVKNVINYLIFFLLDDTSSHKFHLVYLYSHSPREIICWKLICEVSIKFIHRLVRCNHIITHLNSFNQLKHTISLSWNIFIRALFTRSRTIWKWQAKDIASTLLYTDQRLPSKLLHYSLWFSTYPEKYVCSQA